MSTTQTIYPCLWFENNAKEAVAFYLSLFKDSDMHSQNAVVSIFDLCSCRFMAMNGGPKYRVNSAISYFVYCGSEPEIDRLFAALSEGGKVMIPLGKHEWSPKYAWVEDRYGVSWQLDMDPINSSQRIVPSMLFTGAQNSLVKEAMSHYTSIFSPSMVLMESPYPEAAGQTPGALLFAQFKLHGVIFNAMSSPMDHEVPFSPGNSFVVECKDQTEIDHFWEKLGEGGHYQRCGWLVDRFGISWQVIPAILGELMSDPERNTKVTQAFMNMQKFDIETLINA